jgi:hypothetical protein
MARQFPRQAFVVFLFGAGFYASIGSGQTVFFRYVLPLVPILCLPAAVATARGAAWVAARTGYSRTVAVGALGMGVAGLGLVNCVWFDVLLSRTDSRVLAARWLATRVQAGDSLYDGGNDYTRLDLSEVRYHQWWYDAPTDSFGHPAGETPVWLVLYESALEPYARTPLRLLELARDRYHLVHTIPAGKTRGGSAVYDLQDAFFMPVSGFHEVRRPGPTMRIYRRRDAAALFGSGASGQDTPR